MSDRTRRILRVLVLVAGIKLIMVGGIGILVGAALLWILELGNTAWDD